MDEKIYQKIEAYLGGDMTAEARNEFEGMMAKDEELQKAVKLSNEINHHLNEESWLVTNTIEKSKARQELEDYIKSDDAATLKEQIQQGGKRFKKKSNPVNIRYIIGSIAAVFVAGILLTNVFFNQKSSDDLYQLYYSANDLPSLVKRGADDDVLNTAIIEYKNKRFEKAITSFQEYQNKSVEDAPLLHAYVGFSYLELNKTNEALKSFDALVNSDSIDNSRGLWYKSLVYLKMGDTENVKKVLSEIIADPENFNYNKAILLLEELD
ncbi:tetratricopeptide repeat protein [Aquimarina sp. 2304DJ70-9]|uniref:tetratricopeptide repeat protein n=1 Tax=Aquimarina penaris TaxID=3231044 RepID=UPI00346375E2